MTIIKIINNLKEELERLIAGTSKFIRTDCRQIDLILLSNKDMNHVMGEPTDIVPDQLRRYFLDTAMRLANPELALVEISNETVRQWANPAAPLVEIGTKLLIGRVKKDILDRSQDLYWDDEGNSLQIECFRGSIQRFRR